MQLYSIYAFFHIKLLGIRFTACTPQVVETQNEKAVGTASAAPTALGLTKGPKSVKQNEILPPYDEPASLNQLPIDDELQEVVARRQAAHF